MIDSKTSFDQGPIEFGLVKYAVGPWPGSSIDGFVPANDNRRLKEAVIEIKSTVTVSSKMNTTNHTNQACYYNVNVVIITSKIASVIILIVRMQYVILLQ